MDDKIKKCCPNCSQMYQYKLDPQPKGNFPLFLPCGHSMCENCIRDIVKFEEPLECKICLQDTTVARNDVALLALNKSKLYELFPINYYMVGELASQLLERSSVTQRKNNECFINLQAILKSTDSTQGQCVECHMTTSKMCHQCSMILCEPCFNKSHKNFVIFRNHVFQNIEAATEPSNCSTHKNKPLEYYCEDCSKTICMDCMVVGGEKSCKNHDVVSLEQVNDKFLKQLNEISPKVDETYRRLTKTAVEVGHLLLNIENESGPSELTNLLATIEQHFSKLSYIIQKHKQSVTDVIVKLKCSEKESLQEAKGVIENAIIKAKTTMNMIYASLDPQRVKKFNLPELLEDTKRVAEAPWYLSKDESNDPLKMEVNEDLYHLIGDYIHLEGSAKSVYKLRSAADLPEGVEIPAPPPTPIYPPELPKDVRQLNQPKIQKEHAKSPAPMFFKDVPRYRPKSGSVSSQNSMEGSSSYRNFGNSGDDYQRTLVQEVQPFAESQHPKQLHEGSRELVYVSHIVNPHNFFVQRSCRQDMVKEMLREFRNAVSMPTPSINHVTEGKAYLVYNKVDNMWQRCHVVSIDRKNINKPVFHVFCIDFGSTETVTIDKLRLIPPARVHSPSPLAINCTLANCKPTTGSWSTDDSYLILNIIDNKQVVIHVRHIQASNYTVTLEVDVTTFDDGINLVHALVFHGRATMTNPRLPYPKIMGVAERPKLFISNNDFKQKSVEDVQITHIVSPDKFYVRKCHLQKIYDKLCEDLEQEYSPCVSAMTVYLPEVGMAVAVNLEKCREELEDAMWARGVVQELPGRARVRVLLPDTGHVLLVHWSALRHLHHKYATIEALAKECHLAGVTPLNKTWSAASVALLRKFEGRLLELQVEEYRRGSVGVALYDKSDEENIVCVNSEMIKHKFAVSFGLFAFNKNRTVEVQGATNKSPLELEKPQPKPKEKLKILTKKPAPQIEDSELEAKDKGPLRLEAKLLHYQSPSLLYVSLVHQQKVFKQLYEKLQEHYCTKKTQGKDNWSVNDRCCTVCQQSQTWRRAVIVELDEGNAKVFYSDFACVETVPISNLKELTQEFMSIGDAAIRCHLSGVMPAVGDEWPTITKEFLKELLDAYDRLFITKLGQFKDKSMPIELWVYHTIPGGALEPDKSEWRCLNKRIIEQGLAVPDKTQQAYGNEGAENIDDEMLSFLKNVTGSIQDYLQLEPMPLAAKPTSRADSPKSELSSLPEYEKHDPNTDLGPSTSNTMFVSDWLPPEPLPSHEFTAMPTYIDNEGVIYLHDVTQQDTLDLIRRALDLRFKATDPKAKYLKWKVGEPCCALFFLDNRFYRGRIVEVNNETSTCIVHYVDYGNEEACSFENLRKSVPLYQIPIQAHKCSLSRIRPVSGQWDRQALDYIHKTIVEKNCFVKVVGEPVNGVIPIDLKYDKLWINDLLVEIDQAVYTGGSKKKTTKFSVMKQVEEPVVIESDSGPDYIVEDENDTATSRESFDVKSLEGKDWNKLVEDEEKAVAGKFVTYPRYEIKEFKCNITIINELTKFELSLLHDEEITVLYEELFETVQREGESLPPLDGVFENKACVALFQEDGLWYRASILQYNESERRIKVKYVDYGNIEIVPLADVREIDDKWTELPPATMTAVLHGVKVNPQLDVKSVSIEYVDTFLDKGPFHAKIISYENSLPSVVLRNDEDQLVYEKLIQNGVLINLDANPVD